MKNWWLACIFLMITILTLTLIQIRNVLKNSYDEEHRAIRLVEIITIDRKDDDDEPVAGFPACALAAMPDGLGGHKEIEICPDKDDED